MSGRKTITYINFLQGIPAPIVALGGMIKVFLFYPNSVPHPTKNSTFSHPQYSTGSEQNDVLIYLLYLTKDLVKKRRSPW